MASPRTVATAFVLLVLVAALSSLSTVRAARMTPADGGQERRVTADGETTTTGTSSSSSSLQEALVQSPPLPVQMSPPTTRTIAVFQRRSSRVLGSVPSPGVGH
ncbi:hypothetical protein ACUV84_008956 [Puccinellia chinampoensis]